MSPARGRLRLEFKRVFLRYYIELCSSGIADPSPAFEACERYLAARRLDVGDELFDLELEHEVPQLLGELEQDFRLKYRDRVECLQREPLSVRLGECVDAALRRIRR
jgi:hypothetical protein